MRKPELRSISSSGQDRSGTAKAPARTTDKGHSLSVRYSLLSRYNQMKRELRQGSQPVVQLSTGQRITAHQWSDQLMHNVPEYRSTSGSGRDRSANQRCARTTDKGFSPRRIYSLICGYNQLKPQLTQMRRRFVLSVGLHDLLELEARKAGIQLETLVPWGHGGFRQADEPGRKGSQTTVGGGAYL